MDTAEWYGTCKKCDWPVICACCNGIGWGDGRWDWWVYCANKTCKNHKGEGLFQQEIEWVKEK